MRHLLAIVSNEKGFGHPVIGSPRLNRLGLLMSLHAAMNRVAQLERLAV